MKTVKEALMESNLLPKFDKMKWTNEIVLFIQSYAEKACEEQKKICSKMVSGFPVEIKTESEIEDDILNAPFPIFI